MENFQMFFPCSKSSSSAGSSSSSAYPQMLRNFHGGILGFMKDTEKSTISIPRSAPSDQARSTADDQVGSSSLIDGKSVGNKKKGEKKLRKPKYAFQTRSPVDILDDGYRWRKYGQKAVKNNKFPRSYYRCTHQGCNVKKQVQRLTRDEGVVVTTYEGVHSHPIEKPSDNFEHILSQMQIYTPF